MPDNSIPGPTPTGYQRTRGGDVIWVPPTAEHLHRLLPQYEIDALIGRGGMGAVYKARQVSLDRLVAIKILPPEAASDEDANFIERFKNEARTMAKMNHPAIVHVYDFGETSEGQFYIVMEFVDGTDVSKMILSQGRLPAEHALAITAHVCDALQYAHTHGVIHRDIKPANVLIDMEGAVKVADFGLAKASDAGQAGLTKTNMAMGTPDFVAPEALISGMLVDGRADLYAVGVMLYNMLTGNVPRGMFRMPSTTVNTDPRFDGIIIKSMEMDREMRYQTALDIRKDLDVILTTPHVEEGGPSSAAIPKQSLPQKPIARGPQAPDGRRVRQNAVPEGSADRTLASAPTARSKAPLLIGIGVAAAVAISALVMFSGGRTEIPPSADLKDGFSNSLGMKFVPVPGTEVLMCIHETRWKDYAAYADEVRVTNNLWNEQSSDGRKITERAEEHPVTHMSWEDAQAFCAWLSKKEGKTYRLPTDKEWSFAVGIGRDEEWRPDTTPEALSNRIPNEFPWGNKWPPPKGAGNFSDLSRKNLTAQANPEFVEDYNDGFPTTAPVMSFTANKLGLYDLGGNINEWCEDWLNATQKQRTTRGESWFCGKRSSLFSAYRGRQEPTTRSNYNGFRIVAETRTPATTSPGVTTR